MSGRGRLSPQDREIVQLILEALRGGFDDQAQAVGTGDNWDWQRERDIFLAGAKRRMAAFLEGNR